MYHLLKWASCYTALFFLLEFLHLKMRRANIKQERWFYPDMLMNESKGSCFLLCADLCSCFIQALQDEQFRHSKTSRFYIYCDNMQSMTKILNNINNLHRVETCGCVWECSLKMSNSHHTEAVWITLNCWRAWPRWAWSLLGFDSGSFVGNLR